MFDQPQPNPAEIAEARALLNDLLAIQDQLKVGDRRFVEMRQYWLEREGEAARIGPFRMEMFRRVHQAYFGPVAAETLPKARLVKADKQCTPTVSRAKPAKT